MESVISHKDCINHRLGTLLSVITLSDIESTIQVTSDFILMARYCFNHSTPFFICKKKTTTT